MSTEIKNTLYRFVTMRAPELIEKKEIVSNFVLFPENNPDQIRASTFLMAVSPVSNGKTRAQALKDTATAYTSNVYKTKIELSSAVGTDFYDYAMWLTKHRNTFTSDEVIKKTLELKSTILVDFNAKEIRIWDNLFYQIITSKSSYVRESILSLLVAKFFITNYSSARNDVALLRNLAQARVILPKILFAPEDNSMVIVERNERIKNLPFNNKSAQKASEVLVIQNRISELESIKKELAFIEVKSESINKAALEAYNTEYDADVKSAYAAATKTETTYTDPVTGKQTKEISYDNLVLPEYQYNPKVTLATFLGKDYEDKIYFPLLKYCIDSLLYTSFQQVYTFIDETLKALTAEQFKRTATSQRVASVNGVAMSTNNGSSYARTASGFKFFTLNAPTYPNKLLSLTFAGMESGTDIISGNYTLTFADGTSINGVYQNQSTSVEWINGQLILKLFNYTGHYFAPTDLGNITLTGTFTSSTGRTLTITGTGSITEINVSSNSNYYLSDSYDNAYYSGSGDIALAANGSGRYVYEDLVSGSNGSNGSTDNGSQSSTTDNTVPNQGANSNHNVIDYVPSGYGIKRLGIADYRKVEQEVCCYVPGEVSHIENIMAREYKEKSSRRMRRQEDTLTTSKEKETEKLSDSTSTERFEMNQEVSNVMAEDNHLGVQTSYGAHWSNPGGSVGGNFNIGADFAHNTSQETSNHQAVTNAKEITERVLDRVVQKVKEERITKIIEEYEETDKHGYDNRKGNQHISGVYRWVDKIYRNQVINYGKRLMYEFMIPEPATFHNLAIERKIDDNGVTILEKPIDPRTAENSIKLTLDSNFDTKYSYWASQYNAEIEPMPLQSFNIGKGFAMGRNDAESPYKSDKDVIKIPEGYLAKSAIVYISGMQSGFNAFDKGISVGVGDKNYSRIIPFDWQNNHREITSDTIPFNIPFNNELPVSIYYCNYETANVNVSAKVELSEEAKIKWRIETFNTIITAYEDKLKEYNDKMAELKSMHVEKIKMNPLFYRQIENMVLRKNCIEYMVSHDVLGGTPLVEGAGVIGTHVKYDSLDLETYAAKVKFFEQAFEWNLMSYNFYPFYWAEKSKWQDLYNVEEVDDPLFRSFLQSGMARVIVTVRPGFEEVVNWYMATGQVWNGGQVPTMDDPLFISIVQELRQPEGAVEETWESRVPTSLTVIQAGTIGLNVEGLPCDVDCSDYKVFDSDGHQVFNADGTPKSSNPIEQSVDEHGNPIQMGNITDELATVTDSIAEIQTDIQDIKTTLEGMQSGT